MVLLFDPKKDFKDLKYNVFGIEKDVINAKAFRSYYVLLSTEGNVKRPDLDKILRYAMALYDKRSPIPRAIANIGERKREAALSAGYDLKLDDEALSALFDFTDHELQLIVLHFLREDNNMYWSMIVSNEQTFWEYQRALNTIVIGKDEKNKLDALKVKSVLMDDCNTITERVETYYHKVFGDGEVKVKAKQASFTPEAMANRSKNV